MDMVKKESNNILEDIIMLAKNNKPEDWEKIDNCLGKHANKKDFYEWAKVNLHNRNSGLRDLAASILEQSKILININVADKLFELLHEKNKKNPYPSFRAACALAKRKEDPNISIRIDEIINKLEEFIEDEDVSDIAEKYLKFIKK